MNKGKKFRTQYIVVVMFICTVVISLVCGFIDQTVKTNQYSKEIAQLNQQIKDVDNEIKELKSEKKKLNQDKYIQEIARNRLKMVKPNEIIYIDINKGSK